MDDAALIAAHLGWLIDRQRRPATVDARRRVLGWLIGWLGGSLLDASPDDLRRWQRELRLRVSVSTVAIYTVHVREFYRWAALTDLIDHDPSRELIVPRVDRREPRPMPEEDLAFALRLAREPHRTWLILAAYCGLRAGEIARLRVDSLIHRHRTVMLDVDGKGGRHRVVVCPPQVQAALRPWRHGRTTGWLFLDGHGAPYSANRLSHAVGRELRRLDIPHTLHSLRHRYGTELYGEANDIVVVQRSLGHASAATTAVYVRENAVKAAAAAERLAKRLDRRAS